MEKEKEKEEEDSEMVEEEENEMNDKKMDSSLVDDNLVQKMKQQILNEVKIKDSSPFEPPEIDQALLELYDDL